MNVTLADVYGLEVEETCSRMSWKVSRSRSGFDVDDVILWMVCTLFVPFAKGPSCATISKES